MCIRIGDLILLIYLVVSKSVSLLSNSALPFLDNDAFGKIVDCAAFLINDSQFSIGSVHSAYNGFKKPATFSFEKSGCPCFEFYSTEVFNLSDQPTPESSFDIPL